MSIEQMDKATVEFYSECAKREGVSLEVWLKEDKDFWGLED